MSIIEEYGGPAQELRLGEPVERSGPRQPLHQLGRVRQRESVSRRTVARRLNIDVGQVRLQEKEDTDLWLSTLYEWQRALDVPVSELLVDSNDPLSGPVLKRAQVLRLMKTTKAILERSNQPSIRRMAQMLIEQLLEVIPELEDVTPWHAVGQRRTQAELGQAVERGQAVDWFRDCAG